MSTARSSYTVTLTWAQALWLLEVAYAGRPGDEYRQLEAELRNQGFRWTAGPGTPPPEGRSN